MQFSLNIHVASTLLASAEVRLSATTGLGSVRGRIAGFLLDVIVLEMTTKASIMMAEQILLQEVPKQRISGRGRNCTRMGHRSNDDAEHRQHFTPRRDRRSWRH